MALASAESEKAGIVADKCDALGGVAWLRTEVARFDPSPTVRGYLILNQS